MTDREKAIEQAKQYFSNNMTDVFQGTKKDRSMSELMADFAIEYAKQDAMRFAEWLVNNCEPDPGGLVFWYNNQPYTNKDIYTKFKEKTT